MGRGVRTIISLSWPIEPSAHEDDDYIGLCVGEDCDVVSLDGEGLEHAGRVVALGEALAAAGKALVERIIKRQCETCHGTGRTNTHVSGEVECSACEGTGKRADAPEYAPGL